MSEINDPESREIPRLILERPGHPTQVYLLDKPLVRVGRIKSNLIVLRGDSAISREHCQFDIDLSTKSISVCDLESSNGTFVNGEPISTDPVGLLHGDKVQVGSTVMTLTLEFEEYEKPDDSGEQDGVDNDKLQEETSINLRRIVDDEYEGEPLEDDAGEEDDVEEDSPELVSLAARPAPQAPELERVEPRMLKNAPWPPQPDEEQKTLFTNTYCICGRCGQQLDITDLMPQDKVGCHRCRAVWYMPAKV